MFKRHSLKGIRQPVVGDTRGEAQARRLEDRKLNEDELGLAAALCIHSLATQTHTDKQTNW